HRAPAFVDLDLVEGGYRLLVDHQLLALRLQPSQLLERDVALHQVARFDLGQGRLGHLAQPLDDSRAAGVEHAAARWGRGARYLSVEADPRSLLALDVWARRQ